MTPFKFSSIKKKKKKKTLQYLKISLGNNINDSLINLVMLVRQSC